MGQDQSIRRVVALPLPVVAAEGARWAADVPEVAAQMGPRVARAESRPRAMASLHGLLSPIARHMGWQLAE